jgi:DNA-binding CsgD family transcriptional regulator
VTTPPPDRVDWEALSDRGKAILQRVAVPHSLGLTYAEIGARLDISESRVQKLMGDLRAELLAQVEDS